jgi:hypothetical protein
MPTTSPGGFGQKRIGSLLALALLMAPVGAHDVNTPFTPYDFTVFANLANASADFHRRQLYPFWLDWKRKKYTSRRGRVSRAFVSYFPVFSPKHHGKASCPPSPPAKSHQPRPAARPKSPEVVNLRMP